MRKNYGESVVPFLREKERLVEFRSGKNMVLVMLEVFRSIEKSRCEPLLRMTLCIINGCICFVDVFIYVCVCITNNVLIYPSRDTKLYEQINTSASELKLYPFLRL